ncbi:MAG: hypothetical protein Q9217_001117 [Psora testacea]
MKGQHGLEWVQTTFGLEPHWTTDPEVSNIEAVIKTTLKTPSDFEVVFIGQGAFNKLYKVQVGNKSLMMRISLPVDPQSKTESEVATLHFMLENNIIPVPKVQAYNSSSSGPIGFEWILMDFMPGMPLQKRWKCISWAAKVAIVEQLAVYSASMYRRQFRAIGNIYPDPKRPDHSTLEVKKIVSMHFFWGDHISQAVSRGPFHSSQDWIAARLSFNEADGEKILRYSGDEDEREDAENTVMIVKRLRNHLSEFFPAKGIEKTMLFHDDLSQQNILVANDGRLTAVVDWECVSALPLWKACQYPAFLEGSHRNERPIQDAYGKEENGEANDLFWEHLLEYELTLLRTAFLEKMYKLEYGWIDVFRSSQKQRDFDLAAQNCDNPFCLRIINSWLDDVEKKNEPIRSLSERLQE